MDIKTILRENGGRVTPERIAIFNFLQTKHIFTYNDILDNFENIGRSSVFRTLNLFNDLGIIKKVQVGNNSQTYQLNEKDNNHDHFKCEKCGKIFCFEVFGIDKILELKAKKYGFKILNHNISISGICDNCLINN